MRDVQNPLPGVPGEISRNHAERSIEMQGTDLPEGYRPIIGIPIPVQQGSQGPLLVADAVGAWAVERMSGRVLLIPLWPFPTHKHRYQSLWPLLQVVDGLLLPAGPSEIDWYTVWMEQATSSAPLAWALSWEIAFAQLATWMRMPILAIAEGAEKWNVALGGHWQSRSFVSETPQEAWTQQTIRVRTNSAIGAWIQQVLAAQHTKNGAAKPWSLPLCQQRIVAHLGMGLRSCAQTDEGLVVAFERRDPAFGLGMLARLDWGLDEACGMAVFDTFLQACRCFALTRQHQGGWEVARDPLCATIAERVEQGLPLIAVSTPATETGIQKRSAQAPLASTFRRSERLQSRVPTREELNHKRRLRLKGGAR